MSWTFQHCVISVFSISLLGSICLKQNNFYWQRVTKTQIWIHFMITSAKVCCSLLLFFLFYSLLLEAWKIVHAVSQKVLPLQPISLLEQLLIPKGNTPSPPCKSPEWSVWPDSWKRCCTAFPLWILKGQGSIVPVKVNIHAVPMTQSTGTAAIFVPLLSLCASLPKLDTVRLSWVIGSFQKWKTC